MKQLTYCMQCGNKTLNWTEGKKWSCSCGFALYHNVAGAVAVIIRCQNEVLFTKRNRDPKKGMLDLAGGFVDPDESAENTCKRELFEELKLNIDISKLRYISSLPNVYNYKDIDYNTIDLFYEYLIDEKLTVTLEESEISETIWLPISEINIEELAFDSQKRFLVEYLKNQPS